MFIRNQHESPSGVPYNPFSNYLIVLNRCACSLITTAVSFSIMCWNFPSCFWYLCQYPHFLLVSVPFYPMMNFVSFSCNVFILSSYLSMSRVVLDCSINVFFMFFSFFSWDKHIVVHNLLFRNIFCFIFCIIILPGVLLFVVHHLAVPVFLTVVYWVFISFRFSFGNISRCDLYCFSSGRFFPYNPPCDRNLVPCVNIFCRSLRYPCTGSLNRDFFFSIWFFFWSCIYVNIFSQTCNKYSL